MSNKNYIRGVTFERERMKEHKRMGAKVVARTAGSHSQIDLFSIYLRKHLLTDEPHPTLGRICFEQVEVTSNKSRKKLLPFGNGFYYCTFEIKTKVIPRRKKHEAKKKGFKKQ